MRSPSVMLVAGCAVSIIVDVEVAASVTVSVVNGVAIRDELFAVVNIAVDAVDGDVIIDVAAFLIRLPLGFDFDFGLCLLAFLFFVS